MVYHAPPVIERDAQPAAGVEALEPFTAGAYVTTYTDEHGLVPTLVLLHDDEASLPTNAELLASNAQAAGVAVAVERHGDRIEAHFIDEEPTRVVRDITRLDFDIPDLAIPADL